jgi:hypothetical protein
VKFEIRFPEESLERHFSSIYARAIDELRADDVQVGAFQPPFKGAGSHPTFKQFIELPMASRMEFVDWCFKFDLLRLVFVEESTDHRAKWRITSLDSMDVTDGAVYLRGRAQTSWPRSSAKR